MALQVEIHVPWPLHDVIRFFFVALWSVVRSSRKEAHLKVSCLSAQIHSLPLDLQVALEKRSLALVQQCPSAAGQPCPRVLLQKRFPCTLAQSFSHNSSQASAPETPWEDTPYNPSYPAWTALAPNFRLVVKMVVTNQPGKGLQLFCATCSGQQHCQ